VHLQNKVEKLHVCGFVGDKCTQNLTYTYEIWHNIIHTVQQNSQ